MKRRLIFITESFEDEKAQATAVNIKSVAKFTESLMANLYVIAYCFTILSSVDGVLLFILCVVVIC